MIHFLPLYFPNEGPPLKKELLLLNKDMSFGLIGEITYYNNETKVVTFTSKFIDQAPEEFKPFYYGVGHESLDETEWTDEAMQGLECHPCFKGEMNEND